MTIDVSTLENRAMLARLYVSQWTARVLDRKETRALTSQHGVADSVASTYKSVLWWAPELEAAISTGRAIGAYFRENTLPWEQEGSRIFQASNYIKFARAIGELMQKRTEAVDALMAIYDQRVAEAPHYMKGLYNPNDYPPAEVVRSKFQHAIHFAPLATDWRVEGVDAHMDQLKQQHLQQLERTFTEAHTDAWRRLHERIVYMRDKLKNPDAKRWHDSFLEASSDLCRVLTDLNIAKDPELEARRQELERSLVGVSVDQLREEPASRTAMADKMDDILAKMGALYAAPVA